MVWEIRAKMQGGPMAGQYHAFRSSTVWGDERIEVSGPAKENFALMGSNRNTYEPISIRRGHYSKSNKKLKNGTIIYIWMGWHE